MTSAAQMSPSKGHASVVTAADSRAVYLTPLKKIWKDKDACRMIIVACSDQMRPFMEKLGTQPDRIENEVSSASNPQLPDDQFS